MFVRRHSGIFKFPEEEHSTSSLFCRTPVEIGRKWLHGLVEKARRHACWLQLPGRDNWRLWRASCSGSISDDGNDYYNDGTSAASNTAATTASSSSGPTSTFAIISYEAPAGPARPSRNHIRHAANTWSAATLEDDARTDHSSSLDDDCNAHHRSGHNTKMGDESSRISGRNNSQSLVYDDSTNANHIVWVCVWSGRRSCSRSWSLDTVQPNSATLRSNAPRSCSSSCSSKSACTPAAEGGNSFGTNVFLVSVICAWYPASLR